VLLLAVLVLACACSKGDAKPTEIAATPAIETRATAVVAQPTETRQSVPGIDTTPLATPAAAAREVAYPEIGLINVWVYADSPASSGSCAAQVKQMIPDSAPSNLPGKSIPCEIRANDSSRLSFTRSSDRVFHLANVQLLLLHSKSLPTPYQYSACTKVLPFLLPGSASADAAGGTLVCSYVPTFRGEQAQRVGPFWGARPAEFPASDFAKEVYCPELVDYLSRAQQKQIALVPCVLDVPR